MKRDSIDLEFGLIWRTEYENFDVTLHSTSANGEDQHIEVPHSPLSLDIDKFASMADGDPEEYAREFTKSVFTVAEVEDFLKTVANIADRDGLPLHVRLLIDPSAPGPYHALRWETGTR